MFTIINGKIFDGDRFQNGKALIIENDRIINIVNMAELDAKYPAVKKIDAKNGYVTPGFMDLQLNGCGGVLLNDSITVETLEVMHKTNLKYGCTSFTPTLITTGDENIKKALKLMKDLGDKESKGVLGLHIEGPFISLEKKGIHNPKFIRKMDEHMLSEIAAAGGEDIKIITVAPENISGEYIGKLSSSGIKVALGHTNATYKQVEEKKIYGITMATHLYNGMSSFTHRELGAAGATMNLDIRAGIIADGFHCEYQAIEMAHKLMGERLFLVTDAVAPAGTDMEFFYFEGNKVYHKDGKCFGEDGTLGGSALTMIAGVQNLVNHAHLPLEEAVRMATLYPARAIDVDDRYGKLQPGYYADIVIMDEKLNLISVIAKGEIC